MTCALELCCLLLCLLAFSIEKVLCDNSHHASVLNIVALDVGGLANAMQEMHALRHGSLHHWEALKLRLLSVEEDLWAGVDTSVKKNVTDYLGMKVKFHSVEAAPVARFVDDEGWSYGAAATLSILDSIETAVAWGKETENTTVLSVAFGGYKARPMRLHGGDLFGLFKRVHWHSVHGSEVCLVAKTRALGELSDWRDLQFFVGSASTGVLEWVGHVRAVYRSYVLRPAFAMPEPRPALLEAAHLTSATVTHRTFFPEDICVMGAGAGNSAVELECSSPRAVTVKCDDDSGLSAHAACLSLSPLYIGTWHGKLEMHMAKDLSEQLQVPKRDWSTRLSHGMHHGVQALRRNTSSTEPGKYCWATGKPGQQRPPDAWIHNSDNTSRRFDSAANPPPKVNWRIGLASGAFGARHKIGKYLHQHISKAYYAARHGYSYHMELSNKFVTYMHIDAMLKNDWYSRAVLSKPLMVLSMMHRLPDTDWLFFTDEDVHINAQWTHYPLDVWLADVPADKVFVHTNYRSLMSGAFFIRNSAEGRQFVRDWIAVIMSGFIGCHGWDQAALEVLFFLRQTEGGDAHWSERPYGFDCMESDSVYRGINGTGCTDGHSWSCDYMFERKLQELGFWNTIGIDYFKNRFSSYSRGCANDAIRDFHIVPETSTRPRLQCFHCTDHSEIGTGVWDGMLGGGNDLVRSGAIDSYFTGHKTDWVFHEQWLQDDACSRLDGFLPACPRDVLYHTAHKPGRLLSMFDGWAYDIKEASFCAVDASHAEVQRTTTFMKEYPEAIAAANAYTDSEWVHAYTRQGGGENRLHCLEGVARGEGLWEREVCREKDGIKFPRKHLHGSETWWLLPPHYCEECHADDVGPDGEGQGRVGGERPPPRAWPDNPSRKVVDCSHGSKSAADIIER